MKEGAAPVVVHRADYAPPAYWIRAVDLTFDLDPVKTIVASRLTIERNPQAVPGQPLVLHGEGLNLMRVMSGGESVSFRHEADLLTIDQRSGQVHAARISATQQSPGCCHSVADPRTCRQGVHPGMANTAFDIHHDNAGRSSRQRWTAQWLCAH